MVVSGPPECTKVGCFDSRRPESSSPFRLSSSLLLRPPLGKSTSPTCASSLAGFEFVSDNPLTGAYARSTLMRDTSMLPNRRDVVRCKI